MTLTGDQEIIIEYLSKKVISYKRIQDITLLKVLVEQEMRERSYQELLRQEKYAVCILIERDEEGTYYLTERFRDLLRDDSFRDMVLELLQYYDGLLSLQDYQRRLGVECS